MENETQCCDFTSASDLELFIASLEEILLDWDLHKNSVKEPLNKDYKHNQWCSSSQSLIFADTEFMLMRYYLQSNIENNSKEVKFEESEEIPQAIQDMMIMDNDFISDNQIHKNNSHPISRWYGLKDFLILAPHCSSSVASESRIKILLSAISIASCNIKCRIPIFIQALEPWQNYFLGVFQSGNIKTDFNMVHLKRTPHHCKFLTGLLNVFKTKLGFQMFLNTIIISVQFTYILKNWANNACLLDSSDLDGPKDDILNFFEINFLPFGLAYDSIDELKLSATWPCLSENSIVDGENYSDLDPLQAPIWKVSIKNIENLSCSLSECFSDFLYLACDKNIIKDLLGNVVNTNIYGSNDENDITSCLNSLTESKISVFSKAVMGTEKLGIKEVKSRLSNLTDKPLSSRQLMMLLYYLFPDANDNSKTPYSEYLGGRPTGLTENNEKNKYKDLDKLFGGTKSAPFDGLLWRLSVTMAHVTYQLGGIRAAAYFWYEFIQELRFRWENGILLQGLESALPDSKTCLLNQKLQLLNCCISRRIQRDKDALKNWNEDIESEGDDEFYDCNSNVDDESDTKNRKTKGATAEKPRGRLAKCGDLKLLETGEPLYIPVTQDSAPKTEDQLEEDTQVLLNLGADALGSELRARLLSAYLLSDMEAFKAANPGCILADFIRWCSPRDWIEEESEFDEFGQKKGHLSTRMEIPGNTWLEVWQMARPSPAKWQKRLFNDTQEAEKVLDYLEKKSPKEFTELLLPVFSVCVIHKLMEEAEEEDLPIVNENLTKLVKKVERLGRMPKIDIESYKELANDIAMVETLLVHSKCLKRKFTFGKEELTLEMKEFIKSLLCNDETIVPGGPKSEIGEIIRSQFSDAMKKNFLQLDSGTQLTDEKWNTMSPFPSPYEKEMILRLSTEKGPQRLHAIIKKNECRLCGAFTKNLLLHNC